MYKRLYKSKDNRVITGVCGGISEYFAIDPTIVRIVLVLIGLMSAGTVIIAYIIAAVIIPEKPAFSGGGFERRPESGSEQNTADGFEQSAASDFDRDLEGFAPDKKHTEGLNTERSKIIIGIGLVLLGIFIFARQFLHWFDARFFWPLVIIALGAVIIIKGGRKTQ